MSNDDLYRGLAMFKDGLSQYNVSQAVNDANKQMTEINQSALDENQRLQAQSQLQNDLTMRLGAAGADASKIAALTSNLAPSAGAQYQAGQNMDLQANSQAFQSSEKSKDRAHDLEMQQMKMDALTGKGSEKINKFIVQQSNTFYKREQKAIDAVEGMNTYKEIIDQNPSRLGVELAKRGLITATGDTRVSDEDLKTADNDPTFRGTIARRLKLELTGDDLQDKQKFYKALLDNMEQHKLTEISNKIKGEADSFSSLYPDADRNKFEQALRDKVPALSRMQENQKKAQAQQKQQQVAKLQAWLNDPVSKQPEFASKRTKVMEALSKLQQGK